MRTWLNHDNLKVNQLIAAIVQQSRHCSQKDISINDFWKWFVELCLAGESTYEGAATWTRIRDAMQQYIYVYTLNKEEFVNKVALVI